MEQEPGTGRDLDAEQQRAIAARLRVAIGTSYEIERELGRGGMATVHLARDLRHQRQVALKVLDPALGAALGAPRFRREITLAAQLQHPHIVPVFDSGETADGDLWYTMPYVPGESLRARLRRERRLSLPVVQTLARQIASALDYAHRRGTVHRDIKPENVLLSEDGDALVADFGIARDVAHPSDGRLTATGLSLGTPGYMSPEQIAGEREVDGRTDQYALGCLVYEALTGRPPFEGATAQAVIAKHAAAPVPLLRAERPSLPVSVEEAVARAMAKAPNERFPSAGAFAEALGYEGASTPAARDVPPAAGVSGSVPRVGGGRTAWMVGAIAVLVLSGAGAWWVRGRPQPAPAVPEFDPERVAVAAFQNRSGDKALDQVVQEFEEAIVQGIAQTPDVDMVPASVVRAAERRLEGGVVGGVASGDAPNAESLGRELGAGVIVGGSVSRGTGDSLVVRATITDGRTGRLLSAVEPIGAPRHALGPVVATVRERIRGGAAMVRYFGRDAVAGREPPLYASVWETREAEAIANTGDAEPGTELRHLEKAIQLDSGFLLPRINAARMYEQFGGATGVRAGRGDSAIRSLETVANRMTSFETFFLRFTNAGVRSDNSGMIDALQRAIAVDSTSRARLFLPYRLLGANRLHEYLALEMSSDSYLPRRLRGRRDWTGEAIAHHLLGNHREELESARALRRERPSDLHGLAIEAIALASLDSLPAVAARVEEAFSLPIDHSVWLDPCDCKTVGTFLTSLASELEVHGHVSAARSLYERALVWYRGPGPAIPDWERRRRIAVLLFALERWDEMSPVVDSISKFRVMPDDQLAMYATLEAMAWRGMLAAGRGDRAGAERALSELARRERVVTSNGNERRDMTVLFLEANVDGSLGKQEAAVARLRLALPSIGEPGHWIAAHRWAAFRSLRGYRPFEELMKPK